MPLRTVSRLVVTLSVATLTLAAVLRAAQVPAPTVGADPGPAVASVSRTSASLSNATVAASWLIAADRLKPELFENRLAGQRVRGVPEMFRLVLDEERSIAPSDMRLAVPPRIESLAANPKAARAAERVPGRRIVATLEDVASSLKVVWRAILRDGSTYVRYEITVTALNQDLPLKEFVFFDGEFFAPRVVGRVPGSPVVSDDVFFGVEHPMSTCEAGGGRARCRLKADARLRAGSSVTCSAVMGAVPPRQLRRGVLNYIERERAQPYHPFLHYNTWYDIGYFSTFDERAALDAVEAIGKELTEARGVRLASFLFDDGWDDPRSLWRFHAGFPSGFSRVRAAASKYGAAPGVWLSPWGGYGEPKETRLAFGRTQQFETNDKGFALSGPVYYRRFRDACLDMVRTYGVNQFKFDGIGLATGTVPGSEFGSDFEAAIALIAELRAARPDLYVNLTTGTWPSPFWLLHADSIWRGGEDHDFAGVGSDRQRWITYRDATTFANIVQEGPLFPLSSLMVHGLIYAAQARNLSTDPAGDFPAEVRSFFGSGTQLQELYVSPRLLSAGDWDAIAEAATWSRRNANVLRDTRWIGGDPAKFEVYGWAAWSPDLGTVTLRNPSDQPASFTLEVRQVFDLPAGAPTRYQARSPWAHDKGKPAIMLVAGRPHALELRPFEVMTLEARPVSGGR